MRKTIKIILLFAACSAISILGWLFVFVLALSKSGFGIGVRKPTTTLESAAMLAAIALPFILFPIVAWKFRKDLKVFSIVFGLGPFLLIFVLAQYFNIRDEMMRRKYLIDNPPTGQVLRQAPDGRVTQIITTKDGKLDGLNVEFCADNSARKYGNFENGKGVGIHLYSENCSNDTLTVKQFGSPGDVIDEKRLFGGKLSEHTYRDTSYLDGIKDITLEYKRSEISKKWFLESRTSKIRKDLSPNTPVRTERQSFDEDGRLLSEGTYSYGVGNLERKFDKNGSLVSETTQVGGNRTVKVFDRKGHLTQECQFDIMNKIVSIKDPNAKCTTN